MTSQYRGIALEGGGVAGTAYAGVIDVLEEIGLYSKLTHFAGSSAGSMVAGLMACRVLPHKVKEVLLNLDFKHLEDDSWFIFRDIYRLCKEFGWNKGDAIEKVYGDILEEYVGNRNITYADIKTRYNATLITTSTDLTEGTTIYRSPESTPDMTLVEGVRESASIPLFYCPVENNGKLMVDGGTLNNYPIKKLYDYLPREQVFGAKLTNSQVPNTVKLKKPGNLLEYIRILVKILHEQNLRVHVEEDDWRRTINVDIGKISATDFDISQEGKMKLIKQGQAATRSFFTPK